MNTDWSWTENKTKKWLTPEPVVYYLSHRWQSAGFVTLLDHGCGLGRHSVFFAKRGFDVTAFDQSVTGLESTARWAVDEGLDVAVVQGDMKSVPLPNASFDCCLCWNVIYHATFDEVKQAAAELSRLIRPGGELYITMVSKSSPQYLHPDGQRLDGCTVLASEMGSKNSAAHCYLDCAEMIELFSDFEFALPFTEEFEYNADNSPKNSHWNLLLQKKLS